MRWDGPTVEFDAPMHARQESIASTFSTYEARPADLTKSRLSSYSTENEFSFEDFPFELDKTPQSCHGLSLVPSSPTTSQAPLDLRRFLRGYPTLTAAEEQSLLDIAMPGRMLSQVKSISSEPPSQTLSNFTQSRSPSPKPETRTHKNKKRKSIIDDDEVRSALYQSRKRGHNAVEKRYRTNLNAKMSRLLEGIPPFWRRSYAKSKYGDEGANSDVKGGDSKTAQSKYGKAAILTQALEYIQHLESTTQRLGGDVVVLKARVGAFEKLATSGSIIMNSAVAPTEPTMTKKKRLESIQAGMFFPDSLLAYLRLISADFKQVKRKSKSASGPTSSRNSKKG